MMKLIGLIAGVASLGAFAGLLTIDSKFDTPLDRAQYDGRSGHVFAVAQRGGGKLDEIDPRTYATVATYDLPGCEQPRGLVLAANGPWAYIVCAVNPAMVKFDLLTHRIVAKEPYELRLREDTTASSSSPSARPGWR
jgi:streptogramin lyase